MANLRYSHPTDNIAGLVVPTLVTGTANSAYPLTWLYDGRPDHPFRITTTGPFRIVWDWTAARTLGTLILASHNLDAALDVRFQMHTANTWGSPDIDLPVTIPAAREDGWPITVPTDLSAQAAKRYASLYVPVNSVIPSLGEVRIEGVSRSLIENIEFGSTWNEEWPGVVSQSPVGPKTGHDWGVTDRALSAVLPKGASAAGAAAIRSWLRACRGEHKTFSVWSDPAVNEALIATHGVRPGIVELFNGNFGVEGGFLFLEVSGGVP